MNAPAGHGVDVAIVGGGIVGLACAWRLTTEGARVTVIDPDPGQGTSQVAAGMLAPATEHRWGDDALLAATTASARSWPAFAAELTRASGREVVVSTAGTLVVAVDAADHRRLQELDEHLRHLEVEATPLDRRRTRVHEPALGPAVRSALAVPGDRCTDPRRVVTALLEALETHGATVLRARAHRLRTDRHGRVAGVDLTHPDGPGHVPAPTVVLATGAARHPVEDVPAGDRPHLRPVKGQVLVVTPATPAVAPPLSATVRAEVRGRGVYLVPRPDGRVVVGATVEERGWDARVTVEAVRQLLDDATAVVPGLGDAELTEARSGFRPATPDGGPVVGAGATPGLVHATGHHRNGVLLAPLTAEAVAAACAGRPTTALTEFGPERFRGRVA